MKYFALMGLLILVAVLTLGVRQATLAPQAPAQDMSDRTAQSPQPQGDPAAIGREILKVRQLDAQLNRIEARAFESRGDTSLIAYAKTNSTDPALLAKLDDGDKKPERALARVSLLYSGKDFNRAVVDGKYVRRGDRLPSGARVLSISEDSVLIRNGRHRQTLRVPDSRRIAKSGH